MLSSIQYKLDGLGPFLMLGVALTLSVKIFFTFLPTIIMGLVIGLALYGLNYLLEVLNLKAKPEKKDRIIEHE